MYVLRIALVALLILSGIHVPESIARTKKKSWREKTIEQREKEFKVSENPFFRVNKDLRRVGLEEIKSMIPEETKKKAEQKKKKDLKEIKESEEEFESINYRLDPDFRLGYGDSLVLTLWGKIEDRNRLVINREGDIVIPLLGKVSVFGLTMTEARDKVKREIGKRYSNVQFDLNLADVQDIQIAVLGNAEKPGLYRVSPFCCLVEAVAEAEGPNAQGSLANIQLMRGDKQIVVFNAYDFIFKADQSKNLRLNHGDVVFIPQHKNLIAIRGDVRYPGIYEADNNATLNKVINVAGGITPTKFQRKIVILRINPSTKITDVYKQIVFDPESGIKNKDNLKIEDQDTIFVTTALDYTPYPEVTSKVVRISGEVNIPGDYLLVKEKETLKSLIKKAGGVKEGAFLEGAVFTKNVIKERQEELLDNRIKAEQISALEDEKRLSMFSLSMGERYTRQKIMEYRHALLLDLMASLEEPEGRVIIDLAAIMEGKADDIILERGDAIYIPSSPSWVFIKGAVYNPDSVNFKSGKDLTYYLNQVGGPTKNADTETIHVIKANGRAESKLTGFSEIQKGDTIVIPKKNERITIKSEI